MCKKLIILIVGVLLITGTSRLASADGAARGIGTEQSCHNFSHESWLPVSQICSVCHIPHRIRGNTKLKQYKKKGLPWTSTVKSLTYSLYNSSWSTSLTGVRDTTWTSPITGRQGGLPDGLSKLCLSCHNGVIAYDVFNLHHFVSLEYDVTKAELRDPDLTILGVSGPIFLRVEKANICIICHKR
jgi:hypothetical protein